MKFWKLATGVVQTIPVIWQIAFSKAAICVGVMLIGLKTIEPPVDFAVKDNIV